MVAARGCPGPFGSIHLQTVQRTIAGRWLPGWIGFSRKKPPQAIPAQPVMVVEVFVTAGDTHNSLGEQLLNAVINQVGPAMVNETVGDQRLVETRTELAYLSYTLWASESSLFWLIIFYTNKIGNLVLFFCEKCGLRRGFFRAVINRRNPFLKYLPSCV